MDELISRQAAIDALLHNQELYSNNFGDDPIDRYAIAIIDNDAQTIAQLPFAQPEITEAQVKEYCEKRCLVVLSSDSFHRLKSAQRTGRWIWDDEGYHCSECFYHAYGNTSEVMLGDFKFCPNCGAEMEGDNNG